MLCLLLACAIVLPLVGCFGDDDDGDSGGGGIAADIQGTWDRVTDNPETGYLVATDSDILIQGTSLGASADPYTVVNAEDGQVFLTATGTGAAVLPPQYLYDYTISSDTLYFASDLADTLMANIRGDLTMVACVKQ